MKKVKLTMANYHLFRIKTLEELGDRPDDWESDGLMDYLYGAHLEDYGIDGLDSPDKDFFIDGWWVKIEDTVMFRSACKHEEFE